MSVNKEIYNIISSGSEGNCEILKQSVMIDIGVSFAKIKPHLKDIQIVFLSHVHGDHFNKRTLQMLQYERPTVRVACGEWMLKHLEDVNNVDVLELNKWYNYGAFKVSIGKLYHDVPNCFFRFDFNSYKVFRATDTGTLKGITAKDYDLYAVEHNYDEEKAEKAIEIANKTGAFCHAKGSVETHLSYRQAWEFINANKKKTSQTIQLHKSTTFY